jgi:hypothetical protein
VTTEFFKGWVQALGLGCVLMAAESAMAFNARITAEFVPSLADPTNNVFTNTSAPGYLCGTMPAICDGNVSITFPGRFANQTPIIANNPDPRQSFFIKLPADWRDITVQHATTGQTSTVQLRFTSFGGELRIAPNATFATGIPDVTAAHSALWNGGGLEVPPSPCTSRLHRVDGDTTIRFFWQMPVVAECAKQTAFDLDQLHIYALELMYEIRTPTPLNMAAGIWEADYLYTLGPGADFDFGDNLLPYDPNLNIKITLTVSHHLRAVFPPGADRLALEPEGGWIPWLNGGRRPERIIRDQPFQFTSSGPVKMRIECQYLMGGNCAIANPAGHRVPVETRITLPAGMHELTGGPVSRKLLSTIDDVTALASRYVADQTGNLHFEVARSDVNDMLTYPDTTYSGNVTVVWDSFLIP